MFLIHAVDRSIETVSIIKVNINEVVALGLSNEQSHLFGTEGRASSKGNVTLVADFLLDDLAKPKIYENWLFEVRTIHDVIRFYVEMYNMMLVHDL